MRIVATMVLAGGWAGAAFDALRRLGWLGLFLLAVGDSSFIFFPFGNDLLLVSLVASRGEGLRWIGYVLATVAGSLVGVTLVDLVMRKVGEEGLEYFVKPRTVAKLKRKLEQRAGLFVFAGTLVPPPFPFTAVVMTASALQTPRRTILLAVGFGRLLRYTADALLAIYFGKRILVYLDAPVVQYVVWALVVAAVVGTVFSVRKWLGGRRSWAQRPAPETG